MVCKNIAIDAWSHPITKPRIVTIIQGCISMVASSDTNAGYDWIHLSHLNISQSRLIFILCSKCRIEGLQSFDPSFSDDFFSTDDC